MLKEDDDNIPARILAKIVTKALLEQLPPNKGLSVIDDVTGVGYAIFISDGRFIIDESTPVAKENDVAMCDVIILEENQTN